MAIARVHTWAAGEILLAADLNSEFNNIIGNGSDLVSPFTKAISLGGFALNFDAANTIAATATTSGITVTGGTLREPTQDTITAFATGGQTNATALTLATKYHRISVCATAGDSYKLPTSTAGQAHFVRNDGAAAAQAFGAGTDTINGVATATGIPHPVGVGIWFVCTTAGNWTTGPLVAVSGNFPVTLTATASTNVTLPTTGTLATLAGSEALTNKTVGNTNTVTLKDTLFTLQDDGDTSKQVQFQLSGITASNTRTLTVQDKSGTLATTADPITQNSQSVAYTTVLSDAEKHILHPAADNVARTFTIDSNANVAYPIGTAITFVNEINTVTIAITTDTLTWAANNGTGSRTLAAGGIATALKITTTKWIISGSGLT